MGPKFSIYRYDPDVGDVPCIQGYTLKADEGCDMTLLDAFIQLEERDPSLSPRRPCREGVRGSNDLNMNGKNDLACITPISALNQPGKKIAIRPLPGLPVTRDLMVDMGQFYAQYEKIRPYLLSNGQNPPVREHLQMLEQHEKFDGLYGCILCMCCSTLCLSFWWNPDRFIGPTGLLTTCRFPVDSRDIEIDSHLDGLGDAFSVFRCHNIMSCVGVCPEGLDPTRAIGRIKLMLS